MCGIAGILGFNQQRATEIAPRMLCAMRHRGPDDEGTQSIVDSSKEHPPIMLLHRRLSIIDLSKCGHQPMADVPTNEDETPNWITYNGEIFNYLELHEELARVGWACRTRSDTEVILHAYRLWGDECVQRLNGMFAWCLLDSARGIAWFCRDRLGVKPLYLYRPSGGGLLFASEVRTLLAAGEAVVAPVVSRTALESFFAQGAVHGDETIIRNVQQLAPGESLVTDWCGSPLSRRPYWSIPPPAQTGPHPREPAIRSLADRLRDAVRMHLISDVPLGVFLSGGIDSASVATLASEVSSARLRTICIGFDQSEFDESAAAAEAAGQLGTEHQTVRLTADDVLRDLPEVLAAMDQPTVDGFNTWFVARATRRAGLTVALSGLGGDELFGGYASFHDVPRALKWAKRLQPLGRLRNLAAPILRAPSSRAAVKSAELLRRGASVVQLYLLRRELFLTDERRALHELPSASDELSGIPRETVRHLEHAIGSMDPINQVSRLELLSYMRQMLLRDADVFSMTHALEVRVPLLDFRVVEEVAQLPGEWKRPDPRPKPLLIDAVGARLPGSAYRRPKQGFTFPWSAWLRGPLRARAGSAITAGDVWTALRLDPDAPRRIWDRFLSGDRRVSALQVLALLVLQDFAVRHNLRSEL